ncbi:MAG: H-type lectin domain-containing protein [Acidobacteriaceae bacterium]|nr:H-type lectin domain-containing protein [Acidobacteriaceae bacterium]
MTITGSRTINLQHPSIKEELKFGILEFAGKKSAKVPVVFESAFPVPPSVLVSLSGVWNRQGSSICELTAANITVEGFDIVVTIGPEDSNLSLTASWLATNA